MAGAGAAWVLPGLPAAVAAGRVVVENLRMSVDDGRARLVFDLAGPVEHSIFTLSDPDRVVIDIANVLSRDAVPQHEERSGMIRRIRSASHSGGDLRVVLDLDQPGRPRSFLLNPDGGRGYRLVIDVERPDGTGSALARESDEPRGRDLVIAIDPGHGGRDPGAIGPGGTLEKDIALQVSRRLKAEIDGMTGFRAVMSRDSDVFLPLVDRVQFARKSDADLFLSIHADAFRDPRARGSSIYALSTNGATSEAAKWLANRENAADMIGGVSLDDRDDMVASVLLDLSQTATIESSLDVGDTIMGRISGVTRVHRRSVQQAGFVVLKAPDVPSLLVETAFISNPHEERQLRDPDHQRKLARAIRGGVENYFERKAPPGTLISERRRRTTG